MADVTAIAQSQVDCAHQAVDSVAEALTSAAQTQAEELSQLILEYPSLVLALASAKVSEGCGSLGKSLKLDLSIPPSRVQSLLRQAKAVTSPKSLKPVTLTPLLEAAQ